MGMVYIMKRIGSITKRTAPVKVRAAKQRCRLGSPFLWRWFYCASVESVPLLRCTCWTLPKMLTTSPFIRTWGNIIVLVLGVPKTSREHHLHPQIPRQPKCRAGYGPAFVGPLVEALLNHSCPSRVSRPQFAMLSFADAMPSGYALPFHR